MRFHVHVPHSCCGSDAVIVINPYWEIFPNENLETYTNKCSRCFEAWLRLFRIAFKEHQLDPASMQSASSTRLGAMVAKRHPSCRGSQSTIPIPRSASRISNGLARTISSDRLERPHGQQAMYELHVQET